MATILARQTLGNNLILLIDTTPIDGVGIPSDVGSFAIAQDGTGTFYKYGATDSDWIDSSTLNVLYTIELVNAFTTSFYAPFNLSIDSYVQIVGTANITIRVNGGSYTLGNAINTGSLINITSDNTSVVNLNCTKL
jgi:hypothetical protein